MADGGLLLVFQGICKVSILRIQTVLLISMALHWGCVVILCYGIAILHDIIGMDGVR